MIFSQPQVTPSKEFAKNPKSPPPVYIYVTISNVYRTSVFKLIHSIRPSISYSFHPTDFFI